MNGPTTGQAGIPKPLIIHVRRTSHDPKPRQTLLLKPKGVYMGGKK